MEAVDPFTLDEDDLAAYLRAARRVEAWADSVLARGICAFAQAHAVSDDGCHDDDGESGDGDEDHGHPVEGRPGDGRPGDGRSGDGRPGDGRPGDGRPGGRSGRWRGLARPVRFGGEGTGLVDEFAADALAPVLRVAPMTAGHLIGDCLDLWHRLPWVRTGLRDGVVCWQAARAIATGTRELSQAQLDAVRVDRRLYASATRLTPGKLRARIAQVVAQADPDRLDDAAEKRSRSLFVGFSAQPQTQTSGIFGELDALGAHRLDQQLSVLAGRLRRLDPATPWEALRAHALVLLADPAALQRLHERVAGRGPTDPGPTEPGPTEPGPSDQGPTVAGAASGAGSGAHDGGTDAPTGSPAAPLPVTVVHLHTDPDTWRTRTGLVEAEGYGWMSLATLTDQLAGSRVRVVTDTDSSCTGDHRAGRDDAQDADAGYRPRQSTRDAVAGRDRTCRFPGCNRRARACQCDHTVPWPHGPTCPCNLGSLCTRHHRLKTHGGWRLAQPWPGVFLWRAPTGRHYLVDHTGTTALDRWPASTVADGQPVHAEPTDGDAA